MSVPQTTRPGKSDGQFAGEVAVVSGGAGGIGRGVVRALQAEGARVAVLDLARNDDADLSIECDTANAEAVERVFPRIDHEFGATTMLVCASGIVRETAFEGLEPAQWTSVLDASLTSAYLLCRMALPRMVEVGRGSIVTMSSGWGRKGYPRGSDYAAAKSGVEALTKSLALEYASRGIRANSIAPGPIDTAMIRDNPLFDPARTLAVPLGRMGEVDDVVPPILFLLGQGARFITGQVLHVNGGLLMP